MYLTFLKCVKNLKKILNSFFDINQRINKKGLMFKKLIWHCKGLEN